MEIVAQLVRAPDCGSGGRGFETRLSPQVLKVDENRPFFLSFLCILESNIIYFEISACYINYIVCN